MPLCWHMPGTVKVWEIFQAALWSGLWKFFAFHGFSCGKVVSLLVPACTTKICLLAATQYSVSWSDTVCTWHVFGFGQALALNQSCDRVRGIFSSPPKLKILKSLFVMVRWCHLEGVESVIILINDTRSLAYYPLVSEIQNHINQSNESIQHRRSQLQHLLDKWRNQLN